MRKEIENLKKQLPERGYAVEVKKKAHKSITIYQIRNFFQGKPVDKLDAEKIVKAAKKAIDAKKRQDEKIIMLLKSV